MNPVIFYTGGGIQYSNSNLNPCQNESTLLLAKLEKMKIRFRLSTFESQFIILKMWDIRVNACTIELSSLYRYAKS